MNQVNVTDSAVNKIRSLIDEAGNPDLKLRAYITGGGCSGFQYGFKFEESMDALDTEIKKECASDEDDDGGDGKVSLIIDPMSIQYLAGAEIDYQEDIQGERFIIRNPNAKTTCGCGSSFSVD